MSAHEFVYYTDRVVEKTKERQRVILIPSGTERIDGTNAIFFAGMPAWMTDPAEESLWKRIQSGAISISPPGEAGFDKVTAGMAMTTVCDITVYNRMLKEHTGLAAVITNFRTPEAFTVSRGSDYSFTYDSLNLWIITSDKGNESLTVDQFETIFEGVQYPTEDRKRSIVPKSGSTLTAKLYHVAWAAMNSVKMNHVCAEAVLSSDNFGPYPKLYQTGWTFGGIRHVMLFRTGTGFGFRLYKMEVLWKAMEKMCKEYYRGLFRAGAPATKDFFFFKQSGGYGDSYSHITFKRQMLDSAYTPGANLSATSDLILGSVEFLATGARVGGLFVDPGKDGDFVSLSSDRTVWDILHTASGGVTAKAKIYQTDREAIAIYFLKALESLTARVITLASGIVWDEHDQQTAFECSEGQSVIKKATVAIEAGAGEDYAQHTAEAPGAVSGQEITATILLDNTPLALTDEDWTYRSDSLQPWRSVESYHIPATKIFYLHENAFGLGSTLPMMVHAECTISNGYASKTVAVQSAINLPPFGLDSFESTLKLLRANILVIQREAGLLIAVPEFYLETFGNPYQIRYPLILWKSIASFNDLGDEYALGPVGGDGLYTAQALIQSPDDDLTSLPGRCFLISVKPDSESRFSTVQLLGVRY